MSARPVTEPVAAVEQIRVVAGEELGAYRAVVTAAAGRPAAARAGEAPCTASPVSPFVLVWPAFREALRQLLAAPAEAPDGSASLDAPAVHLSQVITQRRPVLPGETVAVKVAVVAARQERSGVRLALDSQLAGADGVGFAEMVTTVLLVGASQPSSFGEMPVYRTARPTGEATEVSWTVPADLPRRYAEVSGDDNPIHLDPAAAGAAGFDGVIVHGMSLVALACEEVVARFAGGDAGKVRGLGARFSVPAAPGDQINLRIRPDTAGELVSFDCTTARGMAVKQGWVELG